MLTKDQEVALLWNIICMEPDANLAEQILALNNEIKQENARKLEIEEEKNRIALEDKEKEEDS